MRYTCKYVDKSWCQHWNVTQSMHIQTYSHVCSLSLPTSSLKEWGEEWQRIHRTGQQTSFHWETTTTTVFWRLGALVFPDTACRMVQTDFFLTCTFFGILVTALKKGEPQYGAPQSHSSVAVQCWCQGWPEFVLTPPSTKYNLVLCYCHGLDDGGTQTSPYHLHIT